MYFAHAFININLFKAIIYRFVCEKANEHCEYYISQASLLNPFSVQYLSTLPIYEEKQEICIFREHDNKQHSLKIMLPWKQHRMHIVIIKNFLYVQY